MIEVHVRKKHDIDLGEVANGQSGRGQAFGPKCKTGQPDSDPRKKNWISEYLYPEKIEARCVRVINRMTTDEATAAQIKEKDRKRYFRVDDDGKANMTAPAESATWFKLISVPLENDVSRPGAPGDEIGVVTRWKLPGVFDGTPPHALARVQAEIDAGGPWAKDSQASDWAGHAIARVLEVDATEEPGKTRVKALLKAWIASGALKVGSSPNPKRRGHDRPTIIVGDRAFEGVR
jgi:hypothetical protein